MNNNYRIHCHNTNTFIEFKGGETLSQILARNELNLGFTPVCALVNNKIEGLRFPLFAPKTVKFLSIDSAAGRRVYIRSLCMMLFRAIYAMDSSLTLRIEHSISKGYYCTIRKKGEVISINDKFLEGLKTLMHEYVENNLEFIPEIIPKDEAIEIFKKENLNAKVKLFNTRHELYVTVYTFDGITDTYYGPLVPSAGYLKIFNIKPYKKGFLLLGPSPENQWVSQVAQVQDKMYKAFTEYEEFNKIIGVRNIGELNEAVINGFSQQLINVAEALHAKKISEIANDIYNKYIKGGARIVLVAGPSSSGKTTTAQRLAIYLTTNLLRPVTISLDNYFVNRDDTPLDEYGEKDYEHINSLDLNLFNDHLSRLLQGEEIELPYYNFEIGKRVFRGEKIKLGENGILLIEGIHGLNPQLTSKIHDKMKYRVYVSALTTLSIDDHNWISTTDNRLLRRIIRDYKYRGTSATETIKRWPSVRRGEERWIFPFQENADAMFNSSLLFELAVMKDYGETILKNVPADCVEYAEAYRLRKFLNYFEPINNNLIPPTSLLREFLGGSSLNY